MEKCKKIILWSHLLNKRFLRKPLLLLLLCLIPLTALLARRLPAGQSDLLSVGVCAGSPDDSLAEETIKSLVRGKNNNAVRYIEYRSEKSMKEAIYEGEIRFGFLFPEDLSELISAYAKVSGTGSGGALSMIGQALGVGKNEDVDIDTMNHNAIRVFCGSNDIVTKLEKEQLFGSIYGQIEIFVLKAWMDTHAADFPMSKEHRDAYLEQSMAKYSGTLTGSAAANDNATETERTSAGTADFFQLSYLNGDLIDDNDLDQYYLSPMRGLLAVSLVLICFSACLFLMQDREKGLFVWLSPRFLPFFNYLYLLIPLVDGGIFAYLALWISGSLKKGQGGLELCLWILYLLAVCGFSNLIRVLTRRMTLFSATIPIVIMGCLFLTPIFFDVRILPQVQAAFPPYLYLKALHSSGFPEAALPIFLYASVTSAVSIALDRR